MLGPPRRLVAAARDHSGIELSWDAPASDGGARVTGYRIELSDDSEVTWTGLVDNTGTTGTTYTHENLQPGTTRQYRVSGINEHGVGPPSNVARASTDAIVPDPPTNLVAIATTSTLIDLTWDAPENTGGAPLTSYRIEVSEDGAASWTDLESATGTDLTAYQHTGLHPGLTRHYRVSAINVAGAGLPSNVASATIDDPVERAERVNRAVLPYFAASMTASTLSGISRRIEAAAGNSLPAPLETASLLPLAGSVGFHGGGRSATIARLLDRSASVLPAGGVDQVRRTGPSSGVGTWGSVDYQGMGQPDGEEIQWEGDMLSIHIGADLQVHRNLLAGVAGSRSSGNYDFTDITHMAQEVDGTYQARMTSVNPYLAWLPGRSGMAVWLVGSLGWGEVAVDDEIEGRRASDARMTTGAVGGSGILLSHGSNALRLRGEGWLSRIQVDGAPTMDALTLAVRRARFSLEWSRVSRFGGGHEVGLLVEGGMRHDGGDGMAGTGVELGGGLRYISPWAGLTIGGHGRMLAVGGSYEEWGIRGLLQIAPQWGNGGLSLKIVPALGEEASGVQDLWNRGVSDRPDRAPNPHRGKLNAQVEYRLRAYRGTPYGRVYVVDGGTSTFGTGVRYEVTRVLGVRIEGTRTQSVTAPAWHGITMRGRWRF